MDNTASDVRFQANNVRCMRYMLTRRGYKGPQATFPVLLMFGSIDWQFHIMFHMEHHNGNRNWVGVTICEVNCRTPRGVPGLATGTGIKKDYSSFFQAVNRVFGNNVRLRGELSEANRLAKIGGADHQQTSVHLLCYTWLGEVASKHWKCCTGDCKWGHPYSSPPHGVQMYLLWDIQQMARPVLAMLWVNALHIFPYLVFL